MISQAQDGQCQEADASFRIFPHPFSCAILIAHVPKQHRRLQLHSQRSPRRSFTPGVAVNMNNLGARALSPLADEYTAACLGAGRSPSRTVRRPATAIGYRGDLRSQLVAGGNAVNIGRVRGSTAACATTDVEGWPGYVIEGVRTGSAALGASISAQRGPHQRRDQRLPAERQQ